MSWRRQLPRFRWKPITNLSLTLEFQIKLQTLSHSRVSKAGFFGWKARRALAELEEEDEDGEEEDEEDNIEDDK